LTIIAADAHPGQIILIQRHGQSSVLHDEPIQTHIDRRLHRLKGPADRPMMLPSQLQQKVCHDLQQVWRYVLITVREL